MSHRLVRVITALTVLSSITAAGLAQPEPIPLDPDADRLAQLDALVAVPGGVVDITGGLMEILAELDEPPTIFGVQFLTTSSPQWNEMRTWAKARNQQHAIERLIELTNPEDRRLLGLAYSDAKWHEMGPFSGIALDDGAPLQTLQLLYVLGVQNLNTAISIEAWDRAENGDAEGVSEVMLAWVRLARILLDRETLFEKQASYSFLTTGLERLRDIIYTHPDLYSYDEYIALIEALNNDDLELDIVRLPRGDRLIAMDLIERTMVPEGEADPTKFGLVMAAGATAFGRPLELFARTAEMNRLGASHAGWYQTYDELNKVLGDWWVRWETPDFHDFTLNRPTDFSQLPPNNFRIITQTVGGIEGLFDTRLNALTELFGTRNALAVLAFNARANRLPPNIRAVSPLHIKKLDKDPWSVHPRFLSGFEANSPRARFEKSVAFKFLVPIRDQRWEPREEKIPYEITVMTEFDALGNDEPETEGEPAQTAAEILAEIPQEEWNEWLAAQQATYDRLLATPGVTEQLFLQTSSTLYSISAVLPEQEQTAALVRTTEQNIEQLLSTGFAKPEDLTTLSLRLADGKTVTTSNFAELYRKVYISIASVPGQTQMYLDMLNGPDPSIAKLIEVDRQIMEEALVRKALGLDSGVASLALLPKFTVSFDESTFLLYSVWKHYKNEAARLVGVGGTDYLIWPPLPSLLRDAGVGN